jgi:hypothetical protein
MSEGFQARELENRSIAILGYHQAGGSCLIS